MEIISSDAEPLRVLQGLFLVGVGGVGFSLVNPPRQKKPLTERWQIERKKSRTEGISSLYWSSSFDLDGSRARERLEQK